MSAATTLAAIGDDAPEEPEVIMGHLNLGALRQVSIPEAVDMTLFALQQARDVFLREQKNLDNERVCLLMWGSMLKKWTASEKQKAAATREWLDEKQSLLVKEEISIGELNVQAWKLMEGPRSCTPRLRPALTPPSSSRRTSTHRRLPWLNKSRQWQTGS
jgi:hypothetical protein